MSQRPSEAEQVKFRDVSVCFSEEEWKTLCQWQKEFYQNVMKEIHQALLLMGYQIVHPDNLLQIYKAKDAFVPVSQDTENIDLLEPGLSSHPEVIPDVLFRISRKEESDCGGRQRLDETGGCNSASSCFPVVTAAFSLTKEQELQLYPMHQQNSQRKENSNLPTSRKAISEVVSANIKEETEICFTEQRDCEIIDVSALEGDRRMKNQKNVGEVTTCRKTEAPVDKKLPRLLQRSFENPNSRTTLWSGSYLAKRVEKVTQCESVRSHIEYLRAHQESGKLKMSRKDNEPKSDLENSEFINSLLSLQKTQASQKRNECNQSSRQQSESVSPLVKPPPAKPYACTDCDKSFCSKTKLVDHYRTHTGEKPHACSVCDKRYNVKNHLTVHMRTHTGERPFTCPECQRTFRYKSDFNLHRRTKH